MPKKDSLALKPCLVILSVLVLFALCYLAVSQSVYRYRGFVSPFSGEGGVYRIPEIEIDHHTVNAWNSWRSVNGDLVYGPKAYLEFDAPEGCRFAFVEFDAGSLAAREFNAYFTGGGTTKAYSLTLRDGWNYLPVETRAGGVLRIVPCGASDEHSPEGIRFTGFVASQTFYLAKALWSRVICAFALTAGLLYLLLYKNSVMADVGYKYRKPLAFFIILISLFSLLYIGGLPKNYYDAAGYIRFADELVSERGMNLLNFPVDFRGYAYPLFLYVCRGALAFLGCSRDLSMNLTMGAFTAFVFAYLTPALFKEWTSKEFNCRQIILPFFLTLLFFRGIILHTLTDFLSAALVFAAVWAVLKIRNAGPAQSLRRSLPIAALCGACVYLAYSVRTVNIALFVMCPILGILLWRKKSLLKLAACLLAVAVGFFAAGMPQVLINDSLDGDRTIMVKSDDLLWGNIAFGLHETRYVTFVGDEPQSSAFFDDDVLGQKLLKDALRGDEVLRPAAFRASLFRYPFAYAAVYIRHILSAMDLRYPEVYVADAYSGFRFVYDILSWVLWYLLICCFAKHLRGGSEHLTLKEFGRWTTTSGAILVTLLATTVLTVPLHVEARYYYPTYLLCFGYLAFVADYKALKESVKREWPSYLAGAVASAALFFSQWSYINSQLI